MYMYSTYHAHEIIKRITEQYVCNACVMHVYSVTTTHLTQR